jgi:hypothetical protein
VFVIESIKIGNVEGEDMQVSLTMRGVPEKVIEVLAHGLPREALLQIRDAIAAELENRKQSNPAPVR